MAREITSTVRDRVIRCCLLGSMLSMFVLSTSCSSDDGGDSGGPKLPSNQYVYLPTRGVQKVTVSTSTSTYTYPISIQRNGDKTSKVTARLSVFTDAEMETYNTKNRKDYTLLPQSCYSITQEDIAIEAESSESIIDLTLDPSKILPLFKTTKAKYVVALKLGSDKVTARKDNLILEISLNYPKVKFAERNMQVSVNKAITEVTVPTVFEYTLDGEEQPNQWNFTCKFVVPSNVPELVSAYNKRYHTTFEPFPTVSDPIEGNLQYTSDDAEATGTFSVKQADLAVKYYLLPLSLEVDSDNVMADNEMCYVQIARTYSNPIITETSVPDPTVIRANDGYFYLYSTQSGTKWVPIYKSKDLVNWEYQRTAFKNATKPNLPGGGAFWAPEIRYIKDKYVLYFSWAKWGDQNNSYTAVATSDSPLGEFPDSKALITNEEFGRNVIDQFYYEDDGKHYMFFGSFNGIFVTELTDDGLSVKRDIGGAPVLNKQVCGSAFEGTNIYKKNGYYYLFASINNCCDGMNSRYKVVVGRSKNILGPYLNKKGHDMLTNNYTLVLEGDNEKWFGPGHNSIIIQDDEGTEWMIYHSYVKEGDDVSGGRLGMLDRVLWDSEGWPYIENYVPSSSSLVPVFNVQ